MVAKENGGKEGYEMYRRGGEAGDGSSLRAVEGYQASMLNIF